LSHKEGYLLTSTLLLGLRRSRQIKERYATSRLSPLNRGENKATDGDLDGHSPRPCYHIRMMQLYN
jgi:hypothetical protein